MESITSKMNDMELNTAAVSGQRPHNTAKFDPERLRAALEGLPQELYDQIYIATFTAHSRIRNLSSLKRATYCKDFGLLQVSHASRVLFAATYYGNLSRFRFDSTPCPAHLPPGWWPTSSRAISWLKMLPEAHRTMLYEVILSRPDGSQDEKERYHQILARDLWSIGYHPSEEDRTVATRGVFRRIVDGLEGTEEWEVLGSSSHEYWVNAVFVRDTRSAIEE